MNKATINRIISGGQTGVDRAALDFALDNAIPCGGWCPKGRKAEDGIIPERYPVQEMPVDDYGSRTYQNIMDSDATLVLYEEKPDRGTRLTIEICLDRKKPVLYVALGSEDKIAEIRNWLRHYEVKTLNIAGSKESSEPGIYTKAYAFLEHLLEA